MSIDLRPLTLGELIDRAFQVTRRRYGLLLRLVVVPSLLILLASYGLAYAMPGADASGGTDYSIRAVVAVFRTFFAIWAYMLIAWAIALFSEGAITVTIADLYLGRQPTLHSVSRRTRPYVRRLGWLWLHFVARQLRLFLGIMAVSSIPFVLFLMVDQELAQAFGVLGAVLGLLAGMAACYYQSLTYVAAVQALMLENLTSGQALARSRALTKGSMRRLLMLTLFSWVFTFSVLFVFEAPFRVAAWLLGQSYGADSWVDDLRMVSGHIGTTLVWPVTIVASALFYFDLRARKEGLDLQMQQGALEPLSQAEPDAALPSSTPAVSGFSG